jgi:hypothetical protein
VARRHSFHSSSCRLDSFVFHWTVSSRARPQHGQERAGNRRYQHADRCPKSRGTRKNKIKNIEVARETAEGQKTEEKPTEDPGQSAPSIDIQIISATNVPSILQKIIEKPTTAINKSQQPQPDKKKPTPASKTVKNPTPTLKTVETSTDPKKAAKSPTDATKTKPLTIKKSR